MGGLGIGTFSRHDCCPELNLQAVGNCTNDSMGRVAFDFSDHYRRITLVGKGQGPCPTRVELMSVVVLSHC